jgi:membrane protein DedA with SNARE-associated domain
MLAFVAAPGVNELLEQYHYIALFVGLLLCGVGLPTPEEAWLLGAGYLLSKPDTTASFPIMVGVCSAAILIGDSIPFWFGRHFGMRALEIRWVRRILHPERFAKLEQRFREHGNWATFVVRFFAGVRIPGYFVAGTMRMSYPRFLLLDALGVGISVPISIYLGKFFGEQSDQLQHVNKNFHLVLSFLVVALIVVIVVRSRANKLPPEPPTKAEPAVELRDPPP